MPLTLMPAPRIQKAIYTSAKGLEILVPTNSPLDLLSLTVRTT